MACAWSAVLAPGAQGATDAPRIFCLLRTALWLIACALGAAGAGLALPAQAKADAHAHSARHAPAHKTAPGAAGRRHVGKAWFHSGKFAGRKMADGSRMNPHSDNAASKTLPLGSRARVTHLQTGKSAVVTIRDRGPHVKGRIIDLSPATARQVGIRRGGGAAGAQELVAAAPSVGERPDTRAAGAPPATGTKASGSGLASDPALAAVLEAGKGAAPEQLAFEGPEAIACACDPMGG